MRYVICDLHGKSLGYCETYFDALGALPGLLEHHPIDVFVTAYHNGVRVGNPRMIERMDREAGIDIQALLIERDRLQRLAREAARHLRNLNATDESEDLDLAERLEAAGDTPALARARVRRDEMYGSGVDVPGSEPA